MTGPEVSQMIYSNVTRKRFSFPPDRSCPGPSCTLLLSSHFNCCHPASWKIRNRSQPGWRLFLSFSFSFFFSPWVSFTAFSAYKSPLSWYKNHLLHPIKYAHATVCKNNVTSSLLKNLVWKVPRPSPFTKALCEVMQCVCRVTGDIWAENWML